MISLVVIASLVFLIAALTVISRFSNLPLDRYDQGSWEVDEAPSRHGFSSDVRSVMYRIDGARTSPEGWWALLERLDDIHAELSPFGENARRPPHRYRTWFGREVVQPDAPEHYDGRYVQTYIETLEQLAGVAK